MADTVQQIKDKLSIVDVVSPYVKLTRAGKTFRGLSPFNKEKTPSFFVSPERGTYYCFSSGQGGDMFSFIEKMEGVDFKGALRVLAEKAGVELVYEKNPERGKTDRLREAVAQAELIYAQALPNTEAYAYAKSRGLTDETIRTFNVGYAKDGWRGLLETLTASGFTTEELLAAGLIKEADGKKGTWYDRFRNRLMFPIKDSAGRTVAFTGRALAKDEQAKYLNSPESDLFKKSQVLFAMDKAKDAIRTRGFAILMEGQMDVLHAHQAGFTNTVGMSGTALSPEHLSLLSRYSDNLMLCLDADRAGLSATEKHAHAALSSGMRVKAIRLPIGKDPADLLTEDPKEFTHQVAEAKSVIEFFAGILLERERDPHKLVLAAEGILLPLVARIKSPMEREHFVGIVARTLQMSVDAVRAGLSRAKVPETQPAAVREPESTVPYGRSSAAELLGAIVDAYADSPLEKRVKNEYLRITGEPLPTALIPERVLFETGILYGETPDEHAADDLIHRFEKETLKDAYDQALSDLRRAQVLGDVEAGKRAEAVCQTLMKKMASIS